jgi:hypothetical protein
MMGKRGRPSSGYITVAIRLRPDQQDAIKALIGSDETLVDGSAVVRRALDTYVSKDGVSELVLPPVLQSHTTFSEPEQRKAPKQNNWTKDAILIELKSIYPNHDLSFIKEIPAKELKLRLVSDKRYVFTNLRDGLIRGNGCFSVRGAYQLVLPKMYGLAEEKINKGQDYGATEYDKKLASLLIRLWGDNEVRVSPEENSLYKKTFKELELVRKKDSKRIVWSLPGW